jgi:hypothetical protein
MIGTESYAGNPWPHTCTSPPNHPYPEQPGQWGSPEGDELDCKSCIWADGYYVGYDQG